MSNKFARKACAVYKDGKLLGKYRSIRDVSQILGIATNTITRNINSEHLYKGQYSFKLVPYADVAVNLLDKSHRWKPTYIFPNDYLISDDGQLYSIRSNKVLRYRIDPDGYAYYVLCVSGERHTIKAHRLVGMAFIPNPSNKPALDHINGIRTDNRVDNLRWVTNKENSNNPITLTKLRNNAVNNMPKLQVGAIKRQYGRKGVAIYKDGQLVKISTSQREAALFTGSSEGQVSNCLSGYRSSCHGVIFKRIEGI